MDVSKRGDPTKFAELHRKGANLEARDQHGMTVLHQAARFGHKEIVQYIIENGKVLLFQISPACGRMSVSKELKRSCHS